MLGTIVNTMAIIAGSFVGLIFSRFIPTKMTDSLIHAVAFAVILIGLKMAWKTEAFIVVICSLTFGTIIGELGRIEDRVNNLGNWLEERFAKTGSSISKGFVTTSLLYCVGSMAIVGALESGLTGNHDTLFAKARFHHICCIHGNRRSVFSRIRISVSGINHGQRVFYEAIFNTGSNHPDVGRRWLTYRGHGF
jgi:uncharacterized membrane protein YqgA involved in biofilm formation